MEKKKMTGLIAGAVLAVTLAACAPSGYVLKRPEPSAMPLEASANAPKTVFSLVDARSGDQYAFHSGILRAVLSFDDGPINPPVFLAKALQDELVSRGVPAQVLQQDGGEAKIRLHSFHVENYRASGFSPFVTFTSLSADLEWAGHKERVAAYVKRGKVPVWSFDEVVEPTFNQPLSLAVKELAAKIAARVFNLRSPDRKVDEIAARLKGPRNEDSFLDVYALGFTNNPKAVPFLKELATDKDEYVQLAAISSLGNLRAQDQFDFLKSFTDDRGGLWQVRGMALKAIGDLGSPEALTFLREEEAKWSSQAATKESIWNLQIIRLYTQGSMKQAAGPEAKNANAAGDKGTLVSSVLFSSSARNLLAVAREEKAVAPTVVSTKSSASPEVSATKAVSPASVEKKLATTMETVKTWRYLLRDAYFKKLAMEVTAQKDGSGAIAEEVKIDAASAEVVRWGASDPLLRSRVLVNDLEWIDVSPFWMTESGVSPRFMSMRKANLFGSDFALDIRNLGGEAVLVGGQRLSASKIEIQGKNMVVPVGSVYTNGAPTMQSFVLTLWYSKEADRLVKLSYVSRGGANRTVRDQYTVVLQALPSLSEAKTVIPVAQTEPPLAEKTQALVGTGKNWRYHYQNSFGKRLTLQVVDRSAEGGAVVEEWRSDGSDFGVQRWSPGDAMLRSLRASGVEWVSASPYLFDDAGVARAFLNARKINLFGQDFATEVRQLGRETLSLAGQRLETVKLEVLGKNLSSSTANFLVASSVQTFTVQIWYAKELGRVVKLSFSSRGVSASASEKYEISLSGRG